MIWMAFVRPSFSLNVVEDDRDVWDDIDCLIGERLSEEVVEVATLTGNLFNIGDEMRRELRSLLCARSSAVERILSFFRDGSLRFDGVGDNGSLFLRSRFSVPLVSLMKGELFA